MQPLPEPTSTPTPGTAADKKLTVLGVQRIYNAFFYSLEGLAAAWKHEQAFRQEVALAVVLVPVALFLPVAFAGKALMVGSVFLVLMVELLNSALEWCVDLAANQQRHPFAKRAKDMGSAAVLLSLVNCFCTWAIVLVYSFWV